MKKCNQNPIIFIPGLMGSMGNDVIEGTGEWSFGVARWIYDPLLDRLSEIGYQKNDNLFVCYYDWRKQSDYTIEKYLIPLIHKVKEKHPNKKIDLICHSMGGIVARAYIQGWNFQHDIDKLIMIGTPNKGSIESYYLWSTGRLMPSKNKRTLDKLITAGYMWILQRLMNFSFGIEDLGRIHATFPSMEDLLPTWDYGDILCYEDEGGEWRTVPKYYIKYKNYLLNRLNETADFIPYKINEMYCIIGCNHPTSQYLMLDKEKLFKEGEEVIVDIVDTLDGDSTVLIKSGEIEGADYFYLKSDHRKIVEESYECIKRIYGYQDMDMKGIEEEMEDKTVHLLFSGDPNVVIVNEDNIIITIIKGQIKTSYPYIYENFPEEHKWLVLKDIPKGNYTLTIDNPSDKAIDVMMLSEDMKEEKNHRSIKAHQENFTLYFEIM
ncbi:MAG: alpha/beta hydrolase [Clostridiaceae bacterium]|nr:alpha/beta hydrolase [Clostridiaceae bacterium]